VELGGQLKELEINYEAGAQDEEKAYNQALQEIVDTLCYELLEIIGPTEIESYLHSTSGKDSAWQDSNNVAVTGTCQPHDTTLQGIVAREVYVSKGMPEDRYLSSTTTPAGVSAQHIVHIHDCLLTVIEQTKENIARIHRKEASSSRER
jgi:hypothetical protein